MNETQRTRILLLLMAGVLLVGGSLLWVNTHREGADDMAMQQNAQLQAVLNRRKHARSKATVAETPPASPASASKGANVAKTATVTSVDLLANTPAKTAAGAPVARLSAVSKMKDKLDKMMAASGAGIVPPGAAKAEVPAVNAANPVPPIVTSKRDIEATPMAVAEVDSKLNAGRANPFETVTGFQPFPRAGAAAKANEDEENGAKMLAQKIKNKHSLVPPPPPVSPSLAGGGMPGGGVALDELPPPPARPSIADKMRVTAVIGDHVLIMFSDKKAQLDNHWPNTVTLGPGEKFESVSLVKVGDDSVTLDDDGERMVKSLDVIK
jgi:hypothetical protein